MKKENPKPDKKRHADYKSYRYSDIKMDEKQD